MSCECCTHELLHEVLREIKHTKEKLMGIAEDLQAKIDVINTNIATLGTDLTAAIADLKAKIVAAGTPIDVTAQLAALDGIATSLSSLDTQAKAE